MTDRHLALVRFITARQPDLRGLREVAFSALVCAVITLLLWRQQTGRQIAWLILLGLFILVQEVVIRVVDWNGRDGRGPSQRSQSRVDGIGSSFGISVRPCGHIGRSLDRKQPCITGQVIHANFSDKAVRK